MLKVSLLGYSCTCCEDERAKERATDLSHKGRQRDQVEEEPVVVEPVAVESIWAPKAHDAQRYPAHLLSDDPPLPTRSSDGLRKEDSPHESPFFATLADNIPEDAPYYAQDPLGEPEMEPGGVASSRMKVASSPQASGPSGELTTPRQKTGKEKEPMSARSAARRRDRDGGTTPRTREGDMTPRQRRSEDDLGMESPRISSQLAAQSSVREKDKVIQEKLALGQHALAQGKFNLAIAIYDEVLNIDPNHASAYAGRGGALLRKGRMEKALVELDKALDIDQDHLLALRDRAEAKSKLGDMQGAMKDFDKKLSLAPGDGRSLVGRGKVKMALGDIEGSIKDLQLAVQLRYPDAHKDLQDAMKLKRG